MEELKSEEERGRPEGKRPPQHEIERAVVRLNAWFAQNKGRIPLGLNWHSFRRQRPIPVFKAVRTTALKDWKVDDLNRLFRVLPMARSPARRELEVPIELLLVDKSLDGAFLNVKALMDAAFDVFAARHLWGRFNPRLRWFWSRYRALTAEIESYVNEIRLRTDTATPVRHGPRRVFEEFSVPLESGQQTALGKNCMFVLDYLQPQGAAPYWRFSVTQHGKVIVGPQVLHTKPIYHADELLAVIKRIGDQAVTLSVLTSESE